MNYYTIKVLHEKISLLNSCLSYEIKKDYPSAVVFAREAIAELRKSIKLLTIQENGN